MLTKNANLWFNFIFVRTFYIKGMVWRSIQQVRLCPCGRHLMDCLYLWVVNK